MQAAVTDDLCTLYHQTEDHFFAATCPLHHRYSAGVNAYFTDEYANPFSLLFIRVGSAPLGEAMAAPLDLIRRTQQAVRIVIHEGKVEEVHEALTALGFLAAETTIAMALELSRFAPSMSEHGVQISLTRNLEDWAAPIGSAFLMRPEDVAHYQARHQCALDGGQALEHFTLSVEGQCVCSLTLSLCDGVARLNDVGTIKAFSGRGYATRLIQAALLHASSLGAQRCFLEASLDGCSLYRRLGFETLFEYRAFIRGPVAGP
ncbi:GNAT family N-acetyltransferase [Pseudomonas sp. MWU15-20650]|uniref:GNAT family N-acetyltransferase n=1 Tax=Pseudomonas sp. MWU15-20650 TaxID=2933107 RepID=UPI00200C2801|nr:GNAT family N-acetyltransferase [Pseudomonas sp. MWU15-20650]